MQAVVPPPDGGYAGGNTAEGDNALFSLTFGTQNTANGFHALLANTSGGQNTATGAGALRTNTTGGFNTATGVNALRKNTTGLVNTANGNSALFSNTTGDHNTATGFGALVSNTTGSSNTAIGYEALKFNISGTHNTGIGPHAGSNVFTANGVTCIGAVGGDNTIDNTTWIANVYQPFLLSGVYLPVVVTNNGQLGTVASSQRFKKDIATMDTTSEAILALRPVTFHYKTDTTDTPQFGLIAEEVAKVNPALVLPDKEGKPYTVRYDAVNAMLLNEFLKEHRKVQELEANAARQQKQIEVLTAGLQKVSAELQVSKAAPQTVVNNR